MDAKVEDVFRFEEDELWGLSFVFYKVYGRSAVYVIGSMNWCEDTIVSTLSHEVIEMLLAVIEIEDNIILPIHSIIGAYEKFRQVGRPILTDEHYINNVDGLPNLPTPFTVNGVVKK
jgi:hypothetical protein